jgi:hypothetical protein
MNRADQFYWWRKSEYSRKTTDLLHFTDKTLSHNVLSSTPRLSGIRTHNISGDRQVVGRRVKNLTIYTESVASGIYNTYGNRTKVPLTKKNQ